MTPLKARILRQIAQTALQAREAAPRAHWHRQLGSYVTRLWWHCYALQVLENQPEMERQALVPEMDVKMSADEMRSSLPLIRNEISSKDGMGVFEPKRLETTWTWVAKSMNYPMNKINPESLVDRRFLPK